MDAVIIGAGQAGLAASHFLSERGVEHVVLERGRIGDTWRTQRWDSFALNTPRWMSRQPGEPTKTREDDRESFLSAEAWVARLEAAAAADRADVRERTRVTSVTTRSNGRFRIAAEGPDGPTELQTRATVVASGSLNVPKVPALASSLPAHIEQLTAATYRRPGDLPGGGVLVVGSAQSGVQIAEELVRAGRTVLLATSSVGRLRRRYRGRDSFEWLLPAGWLDETPQSLADPRLMTRANPQTSGLGAKGHTISLQGLESLGVRLLGRPVSVARARLVLEDTVGAAIAFADERSAEFVGTMDRVIDERGLEAAPPELDPDDVPHPDPASVRSPTEVDFDREGISSVIWTTGFTGDFGYLPVTGLDEHGRPIHRQGISPIPGVYYTGLPWLTKRRSGIILGLEEGGRLLADQVAAGLEEA